MGQDATPSGAAPPDVYSTCYTARPNANQPPPPDKRIFGVLPNYRTANETAVYMPISPRMKLTIASKDSFDYPLVGLAAFLAGYGQLTNRIRPLVRVGRVTAGGWDVEYADQAIGNMMTEGFFPVMLHEDPRYFRRGYGSVLVTNVVRRNARFRDEDGCRRHAL